MYTIQHSAKSRPRACHTCRYLRCVEHHPKDNSRPEFYCGNEDNDHFSLGAGAVLTQTYCEGWRELPHQGALDVFYELTGVEL